VRQKDIAHFDIPNIQAALTTVTPTAFWALYHICSGPDLLLEIRQEAQRCVSTEISESIDISSLDVARLWTTCPLIYSVLQEVLRFLSYNASLRVVLRGTMLEGRYLLQQGGVIHMSSHVIHNDTWVWGPTTTKFEADRFLPKSSSCFLTSP
jgi:cytochrome P450